MMQTEIAKVMSFKGITNKAAGQVFRSFGCRNMKWKRGRVCVPCVEEKQLADALSGESKKYQMTEALLKLVEKGKLLRN